MIMTFYSSFREIYFIYLAKHHGPALRVQQCASSVFDRLGIRVILSKFPRLSLSTPWWLFTFNYSMGFVLTDAITFHRSSNEYPSQLSLSHSRHIKFQSQFLISTLVCILLIPKKIEVICHLIWLVLYKKCRKDIIPLLYYIKLSLIVTLTFTYY